MARVAKYIEREKDQQNIAVENKKYYERYDEQRRISNASNRDLVEMIFSKKLTSTTNFLKSDNPDYWGSLIIKINQTKSPRFIATLKRIMLHVADVSDAFFIEKEAINILMTIAELEDDFIRPIENWIPKSRNRFKQTHHLLRHLFAKYEVPAYLDASFTTAYLEGISLFMNIGQGKSFKDFEFTPKMVLNKKTYHHLFSTPDSYSFNEAFRRAQILSIGGSQELVYNILGTKLNTVQTIKAEEFWFTVIQFFTGLQMFDYAHVPQIVDYITHKKYTDRFDNGRRLPPEQPEFSIKGRTIQALLRQTEEWHEMLALEAKRNARLARANRFGRSYTSRPAVKSWERVRIPAYNSKGTLDKKYEIIQYCTTADLMQEGADMRHCVGSYSHSCSTGEKSIWSLREINKKEGMKKLVTIEINNRAMQITQIKGKGNRRADASELNIIRRWMFEANLSISNYAA